MKLGFAHRSRHSGARLLFRYGYSAGLLKLFCEAGNGDYDTFCRTGLKFCHSIHNVLL